MTQGVTSAGSSGGANQTVNQTTSNSTVTKDEFLKLLTYQLRAQNPLKPYDNQEFAAQLAQFSQLEQLTDIRSLLEEQVQTNLLLTQTISNTALPGLLGKNAKALSSKFHFDGEKAASMGYTLPYAAQSGEVTIKDETGKVVRKITLTGSDLTRGNHKISWDGKDDNGNALGPGDYTVSVELKDAKGASFTADTFLNGAIEAVRFTSEGTVLVIAGIEVPLQNVSDITTGS